MMTGQAGTTLVKPQVQILDTSALLYMKRTTTVDDQARQFMKLSNLLMSGMLAFPQSVKNELCRGAYPDAPAVWAAQMLPEIPYRVVVDPMVLERVRSRVPELADPGKRVEDADPEVLAMAWQLQERGIDVCVVTEDRKDRLPRRRSLASACALFQVPYCSWREFVTRWGAEGA